MNTLALEHEGAMVEVYSKMKPDAFPSQLQNILKPITRISRGLWAPAVATSPRWSSASSRTKRRRRLRFPRRHHRRRRRSHPRHPAGRERRAAPGGEEPPQAPSPAAKGEGGKGRAGGVVKRLLARPQADAD